MALHNPYEVWTMAFLELTTGKVELVVVMVFLIGMEQLLTICSIDLSNPGHETTIRTLAFIL